MKSLLNVLIVDDELLVRNFLRTLIPWEEHGYCICGEAGNGQIALHMIKALQPDIVLLDVSMPVMDGITLSGYIKDHGTEVQMIILSSYQDYHYVRSTMKNGAIDYLLKHQIDSGTLLQALEHAKGNINTSQKKRSQHSNAGSMKQLIKQNYFYKLLLGVGDAGDANNEASAAFTGAFTRYVIVAMQINNYLLLCNKFTDSKYQQLQQSILNLGSLMMEELKEGTMVYMDQGRYALVLPTENHRSEAQFIYTVNSYMRTISSAIYRYLNLPVSWAHSQPCACPADVRRYYLQACRDLEGKTLKDNSTPLSNAVEEPRRPILSTAQEKRILSAIDETDVTALEKIINEIFLSLRCFENNLTSIQIIISELITIATKVCSRSDIDFSRLCTIEELQFENMEKIHTWVLGLYHNLLSALMKKQPGSHYIPYVAQAIEYIKENYVNDISLTQTAGHIRINPPYLSHLFKKETGKSFVDFLRNYRIRVAIKLIKEDQSRINTIYQRVGFNNYNYFFQVFKEVTGTTPKNYFKEEKTDCLDDF